MIKSDETIALLQNTKLINEYVYDVTACIRTSATTRRKREKITATCRYWQLQYCLFSIINNINPALCRKQDFLYLVCSVYASILSMRNTLLYNFIWNNNLPRCVGEKLCYSDVTYRSVFKEHITTNANTYLCIYGINRTTDDIQDEGIVHYFTIIKSSDGFYITSSYQTDHITVAFSINKLDNLEELYTFCDNLDLHYNGNTSVEPEIVTFMYKYFLTNTKETKYSPEAIDLKKSLRFQNIPTDVGRAKEIEYILHNAKLFFDVAIMIGYEELVKKEFDENEKIQQYIASISTTSRSTPKQRYRSDRQRTWITPKQRYRSGAIKKSITRSSHTSNSLPTHKHISITGGYSQVRGKTAKRTKLRTKYKSKISQKKEKTFKKNF